MDSVLFKKRKSSLVKNLRVLLHTNRNALVICIQNRCEQVSFFFFVVVIVVSQLWPANHFTILQALLKYQQVAQLNW